MLIEGSAIHTTINIVYFSIELRVLFRWVPTLTSEDVADRVIHAIQYREKLAIIPRYLQLMLCVKWWVHFWWHTWPHFDWPNGFIILFNCIDANSCDFQDISMGLCVWIFAPYCPRCGTISWPIEWHSTHSTSTHKRAAATTREWEEMRSRWNHDHLVRWQQQQ